jgi:tetratricopeptide (TPR) repeat protein
VPAAAVVRGPEIDPDVTGEELDKGVRRELTTLRAEASESASKHLVMVARLFDDDPEGAYAHAQAARKHGPRVGVIREALGLAAYNAGKYTEALAELRAARRITGDQDHWPMMADCERALGRPEKALQMAAAPEVAQLTRAGKVEMRIVAAGARADLGQLDAAVVTLKSPELNDTKPSEWLPRLRFAYAAALEAVGRNDEARTWFERAAEADPDGLTDAAERLAELDGVVFLPAELDEDDGVDVVAEAPAPVVTVTDVAVDAVDAVDAETVTDVKGEAEAADALDVEVEVEAEVEPEVEPEAEVEVEPEGEPEAEVEVDVKAPVGAGLFSEPYRAPAPAAAERRAELEGVLFLDPGDLG